jgi:predicted  nucleic acid-binding Zn-ribbon protein
LVDLAKYDSLIQDLSMIEAEIATISNKLQDLEEHKTELEVELAKYKQENTLLQKKLVEIERQFEDIKEESEGKIFNTLNSKEKETIKSKLQDIISKIDYHLSSERQS